MTEIFQLLFVLIIQNSIISHVSAEDTEVERVFKDTGVVFDVIPKAPSIKLSVTYPSGAEVNLGNEITPIEAIDTPSISWEASPDKSYTLSMVDPDVPSRELPLLRNFNHWLVVNIPGDDVESGDTLAFYISPTPPPATGFHRYVFLLYEQTEKLTNDTLPLNLGSNLNRLAFNISAFAENNNLGVPKAGNLFKSQFIVPVVNELLRK